MVDFYIAQSPFQLLSATEISLKSGGNEDVLVVKYRPRNEVSNNKQIDSVIAIKKWGRVHKIRPPRNNIFKDVYLFLFLFYLKLRYHNKVRKFFFGDFRSNYMQYCRAAIEPEKSFLIDDGAATINVKKSYLDKHVYYVKKEVRELSILDRLSLLVVNIDKLMRPVGLFTSFQLLSTTTTEVRNIDFTAIKNHYLFEQKPYPYENCVLYFGSKYSEKNIIDKKFETEFVGKIKIYFEERGYSFKYYCHRGESVEKLALLNRMGIDVACLDTPAEMLFLQITDDANIKVASAYSTVINTSYMMLGQSKVLCFKIPSHEICKKYRNSIENVYDYYDSIGVSIVDIHGYSL